MIIHSPSYSFRRQLHSLDLPLQETHLTPTAPREGQSPDLINRGQNQVLLENQGLNPLPGEDQRLNPLPGEDQRLNPLPGEDQGLNPLPGEDQGLAVLDTAVATDISPGHTLPDPHKTGTVYISANWTIHNLIPKTLPSFCSCYSMTCIFHLPKIFPMHPHIVHIWSGKWYFHSTVA